MRRTIAFGVAGLVLLAASSSAAPPPNTASPAPAQCKASGGRIEPVGMAGAPACVIPYADAGKPCRDTAQCKGRCLTREPKGSPVPGPGATARGTCEATNRTFGCFAEVRGGRIANGFMCFD